MRLALVTLMTLSLSCTALTATNTSEPPNLNISSPDRMHLTIRPGDPEYEPIMLILETAPHVTQVPERRGFYEVGPTTYARIYEILPTALPEERATLDAWDATQEAGEVYWNSLTNEDLIYCSEADIPSICEAKLLSVNLDAISAMEEMSFSERARLDEHLELSEEIESVIEGQQADFAYTADEVVFTCSMRHQWWPRLVEAEGYLESVSDERLLSIKIELLRVRRYLEELEQPCLELTGGN